MPVAIVMPKLGMVMAEGTVAKWSRPAGQEVKQGEVIAEIETEKISYELEATETGVLHQSVDEGAVVPVNGVLGYLLAEGEEAPAVEAQPAAPVATPRPVAARKPAPARAAGEPVASTPGARKLAAKLDVDLTQVTPTGPRGRVVEADVRAHAESQAGPAAPPGLPEPSKVVPLEGMRKAIANHMRSSLANSAQLSFTLELDVTEAMRLRKEAADSSGKPIGSIHFLLKACVEAIKRLPDYNTILVDSTVMYFDQINIGIAVALPDGLIVPVLKDLNDKSIFEIADYTQEITEKAREGKLGPDEVTGGTFTISVLGTVDVFTPILSKGQNAILGVGRSLEKPVVVDGEVVVREMMTVSLTTDHQVIDGAMAASFLRRFQQLLRRPAPLFK